MRPQMSSRIKRGAVAPRIWVSPSAAISAARETRTSEAPNDPVQLTGAALLAKELGAKVIEGK